MATGKVNQGSSVQPRSQESNTRDNIARASKSDSGDVQRSEQPEAMLATEGVGLQKQESEFVSMSGYQPEVQPMIAMRTQEDNDLMQTYEGMVNQSTDVMSPAKEDGLQAKEDDEIQQKEAEDIQTQLKVGKPNDKYEQEANKVADSVIRRGEISPEEEVEQEDVQLESAKEGLQQMSGGGSEESGTGGESIQTKAKKGSDGPQLSPSFMKNLAGSGGQLLETKIADKMASLMHADFSNIYIHTDKASISMNQELGSLAFAKGNHVYFNEGQYNPNTEQGLWLLAHELTHTIQQGAADKIRTKEETVQKQEESVQKQEEGAVQMDKEESVQKQENTAVQMGQEEGVSKKETESLQKEEATREGAPLQPKTAIDITYKLNLSNEWANYLDSKSQVVNEIIPVKIGDIYRGEIAISKVNANEEGQQAKYELVRGKKSTKNYLEAPGAKYAQAMKQFDLEPILVLREFGEEQVTHGFLSVKAKGVPILANAFDFFTGINKNLEKLGQLGLSEIKGLKGLENEFKQGQLHFSANSISTSIDGYLEASGGIGIVGNQMTFNLAADVDVAGLAKGQLEVKMAEDGTFSGKGQIDADIGNVSANISMEYLDGVVTIQGTGTINSEKFTGTITLLVTDEARSKSLMHAALGTEAMDEKKKSEEGSPVAEPKKKNKKNQVLAGWGEIEANITPWLGGTAKVGIDHEGHVTIVGDVKVQNEVKLMEQRGIKKDLFNIEIRAGYGIPLVGQVFLFASVGMFVKAGFGPLVLKNVGFTGKYSTDPKILQEFNITGTLGINAFAMLGLEAEAGVGLTLLGHDVKAGINVTAAAGLQAYAEATPTFQYLEKQSEGGKVGEAHLKGHFEAAAQLFLQLSGSLFTELDSPWWSPAPDGREEFPLGEVQYPIGDSMGIGADIDWLVGSPDIPEVEFSPVEFDANKFTADMMGDPPKGKKGKSDQKPKGEWKDGKKKGDKKSTPETKKGKGVKEGKKKKENLKNLPDETKYMRALDEISKLENAKPKPTADFVKKEVGKVKKKYDISLARVEKSKDNPVLVFVRHKKQDNGRHKIKIPVMTQAERTKLLGTAMADLQVQLTAKAGDDNKITEAETKDVIKSWKTKYSVVEGASVVDGGSTWDVKVDIGDKTGLEKGRSKVEESKGGKEKVTGKDVEKEEKNGKEIKVKKGFSMSGASHKLTATYSNERIRILMASNPGELISKIKGEIKEQTEKANQTYNKANKKKHRKAATELKSIVSLYNTKSKKIIATKDYSKIRKGLVELAKEIANKSILVGNKYGLKDFIYDAFDIKKPLNAIRAQIEDQLEKHVGSSSPRVIGDGHANSATAAELALGWKHEQTGTNHLVKTNTARITINDSLEILDGLIEKGANNIGIQKEEWYVRGKEAIADCDRATGYATGYLKNKGMYKVFLRNIKDQRSRGINVGRDEIVKKHNL